MNSQKAYTELLRRHRTLVWTLCWARARGDYECCRDLVQEVSLSLWEHYGRLRPNATALQERAWVLWHTRTVLDHLHRRLSPTLVPLSKEMAAEEEGRSAEVIADLLAPLDKEDRLLVKMRLEGYSAEEIGRELGIKRNAVYQRLHRIIERLKKEKE
ncbi:MAG: sigma-70 family RNA polymerase sigma factor [Bacteroidales bacterium]|nr:sigma-70 family RNA polymerase sigma factor [Bacteroidales bacterium]